jgi:hypothetical protein
MQCTPDLTAGHCAAYFQDVLQYTLDFLGGKEGGQILGIWCNMRYELFPFFQGDAMLLITDLAAVVPPINNTTPGSTSVTVYGSPSVSPAAMPRPDPVVQTTVEQHGM